MRGFGRRASAPAAMQTAVDFPQHSRTLAEFETSFLSSTGLSRDFAFGPYGAWRGALKIPGVWRSSTLLSGLVSALPLEAYRDRAGRRECIRPTPPLLAQPDARPGQNLAVTMQAWVLDYLFHGNALGIVAARSPLTGLPTAVLPVPAEWVYVGWADGSMPSELTGADRIYRIGSWEGGPWDVLHFQGPSEPGALRGLGVLESACTTFDLSRELARQASTLGQHGIPTGVLQAEDPDIGPEELASSKEDWLAAQRDRTVAALAPGVKFAPMAWNPEELQLVEARKFSLQEIALFFGLPGRYLGVESGSLQYSTPELDSVDLLKLTVNRILVAFEQEFSRHLVRGTVAIINREAILETDTKTRYETYAVGLDPVKGWLLRNEVRAYEDLEPVEGWDAPEPPAPPAPPVMGPEQGTIPGDEPMPTEDES